MISQRAIEAIESSDTDDLLRVVDGYCETRSWDDLVELQQRCREAVTRGKQVWGVEGHIKYRLALEAPPAFAGPIVSEGTARFGLGPLPEVAASTKTFAEMDDHLELGPPRDTFAAERVVRGESVAMEIPDVSPTLQSWEPEYPVATYKPDKVETPSPRVPNLTEVELPKGFETLNDHHSTGALADLVEAWTDESNGRCQTTAVHGDHLVALKALGLPQARVAPLTGDQALAWMAWAGASGGAHGKRRGSAAGRYLAWWTVSVIADLDWPAQSDDLGAALNGLRWYWFDDSSPTTGWTLRLTIHDPDSNMAWALSAVDLAD